MRTMRILPRAVRTRMFSPLFPAVALCSLLLLLLTSCTPTPDVVLEGQVTDAYTGDPIRAADVQIGDISLTTDADGMYRTTEWTPEAELEISAPGYNTASTSLQDSAEAAAEAIAAADIETDGDVVTITYDKTLRPTTLHGTATSALTDEPLADVLVTASSADGEHLRAATDEDGVYELEDVPETIDITFSLPGHAPEEAELERTTEYDVSLRPNVITGAVEDELSGEPIADAVVMLDTITTTTNLSGTFTLEDVSTDARTLTITATGYASATARVDSSLQAAAALRPNQLRASLVDGSNGEAVGFATIIATETPTSTAVTSVRIDDSSDGSFVLDSLPDAGYVQVLAPGYRKALFEIEPGALPQEIELEPFEARALYVKTTTISGDPTRINPFFDVIDATEANAIVIDLKSDNIADLGLIYYESQVPIIQELGTSAPLMDIEAILAEAQRRGIYTIARIHVFSHDNLLAETMPEWAAQDAAGCVPNEIKLCNGDVFYADWNVAWLDPWNRNVWEYNIQLGIEAAQLGFDEIQFDYIRFPSDASNIENMRLSQPTDWRNNPGPMFENIATVLETAHPRINNVGAFFSVDIFGYAVWGPQPLIGQSADLMAPHADYIYPMVYPSHFAVNELGFENAAAHPYEIIAESLRRGHDLIGNQRARMRPWLQDFTLVWVPDHLIVEYGVAEVRAQIDAAEESPYGYGWALWDPDNEYTIGALQPAESE